MMALPMPFQNDISFKSDSEFLDDQSFKQSDDCLGYAIAIDPMIRCYAPNPIPMDNTKPSYDEGHHITQLFYIPKYKNSILMLDLAVIFDKPNQTNDSIWSFFLNDATLASYTIMFPPDLLSISNDCDRSLKYYNKDKKPTAWTIRMGNSSPIKVSKITFLIREYESEDENIMGTL